MSERQRQHGMAASRLCRCADAVVEAVRDHRDRTGRDIYPPALVHDPLAHKFIAGYRADEILEATTFLIRLGYAEVVT